MASSAFKKIKAGLEEAIAHAKGKAPHARVRRGSRDIDVAFIRNEGGLTQEAFAEICGVSAGTVRDWEQRRREPKGPSRSLLLLMSADPKGSIRAMQRYARALPRRAA